MASNSITATELTAMPTMKCREEVGRARCLVCNRDKPKNLFANGYGCVCYDCLLCAGEVDD